MHGTPARNVSTRRKGPRLRRRDRDHIPGMMFPTLNVMDHGSYLMGHGSHIRWVSGSWVNSSDPLPALVGTRPCEILMSKNIACPGALFSKT